MLKLISLRLSAQKKNARPQRYKFHAVEDALSRVTQRIILS